VRARGCRAPASVFVGAFGVRPRFVGLLAALLACTVATDRARAQDPACRIEPFRGAASAQGADARAVMVNAGQACRFASFGVPEERRNPADAGRIVKAPAHGTAVFAAPAAVYTPGPGFVGTDAFTYEATALDRSGRPLRLLVRVSIEVRAP
jgi:hypothetical protein